MKKSLALGAVAGALLTTAMTGAGTAGAAPLPRTCAWETSCHLGIGAPGGWVNISVDAIAGIDETFGWTLSPSVGCSGYATVNAPPSNLGCNLSDGRSYSIIAWSPNNHYHAWDLSWNY
ncbi:hypothetical protein [Amycolatopsis magusensis]|uniref:Peptidase inhibitor family I36 n=1 Tax=Amycolatopsis magusensis TaxID=882444 RepID=A0ABS4PT86_9PSEU|nr:hypothetical protein [Amycolatopsis magusensis]MBP2182647.1 hypothetical protein [Amycolatopsis magusensis]MDI5977823.1 hypothetical protein [Amycolatopsis magusensis]